MRILLTGGDGRLARRLKPELRALGHEVFAPMSRSLDATSAEDVCCWLDEDPGYDLVVMLAAFTKVNDPDPAKHLKGNVETVLVTGSQCRKFATPFIYVSTDYVLARGTAVDAYTQSKRIGEDVARMLGGIVVRVAFCDPDDAQKWTWVNGYSIAHREWVEDCAKRFAAFIDRGAWRTSPALPPFASSEEEAYQLGPNEPTTRAKMLLDRFPGHPALGDVVKTPDEHIRRVGYAAPRDTRFSRLWRPEW